MAQRETQSGIYTFSSSPRAILNRSKYREPIAEQNNKHVKYGNIMYDRRVVRGNTHAQYILPVTPQPDPSELRRQQEARRRAIERRRAKEQLCLRTPEPVEGRKHADVQTDLYLLELSDKIDESSVECQTDALLDRPASPLFIPAKSGKDVATQIEEGELFDFDVEVRPMLEVLVGKTVEQALLEVMEEEELARLRAQQRAFEELRSAELVEVQRLEEQERRRREEKERRIKQQREVLQKEKEAAEKIAAQAFAKQYLSSLLPHVYNMLRDNGYFYDPVERDVETRFLPWLMAEVNNTLEKRYVARTVLDTLIRDVTEQRLEAFQQAQRETQSGIYMFSSSPRAIPNCSKYREPIAEQKRHVRYGNIMYDRRVVRGNTYAQYLLPLTPQPDPSELRRQQEARRRAIERRRAKEQLCLRTPEPVEGRKHADVQTDLYLLELSDKIDESSVECQTDALLDRPASPLFILAKSGKDVATQIEEGELFDFDMEVRPMLEVLVGKTVEQALLEVMEEEELARLCAQQRTFEELRSAELVEVQRLEEQERRHREEKERRIKQQREALQWEKESVEKIAAWAFAKQYLSELLPRVYGMLRDKGFFYDPVERDVETGFLPWVMEEVNNTLGKRYVARTILNTLIRDIAEQRLEAYRQEEKK